MNFKTNKQFLLDLVICGFFTVVSMAIIGFIIPEGLTSKFLFRGSKIAILVLVVINIILLVYWFFYAPFKIKKKFYNLFKTIGMSNFPRCLLGLVTMMLIIYIKITLQILKLKTYRQKVNS